ncbi:ATP-binding protein [[Kitasatospora] papulosa]|uniref:ATP-binding protein n=1 Tax=Streptomyces TaxID=1883 RepID=UPI0022576EDF|nr:ATP-binding protein [[Kitasatospora] papulosa]MCX4414525.1 ATP-binding protein [[Kitasatospora] papulosa]
MPTVTQPFDEPDHMTLSQGWQEHVPVDGTVELPPDRRALDSLGRNHSLRTALADLVDNSIDAEASHVLIRFIRKRGRLRGLYVVDNGKGMTQAAINVAMTLGGRREYAENDLGSFGVGLKAASFSNAKLVTVVSCAAGHAPVGRRLEADPNKRGFHCDVVAAAFAKSELSRRWGIPWSGTGTIVRWDEVFGYPATDDPTRVEEFITRSMTEIINHLGLILHRVIEKGRIEILLDVEDVDQDLVGPVSRVDAINPFGYARPGKTGYPKELLARHGDLQVVFKCHIWPPRSRMLEFSLVTGAEKHQGLFFYRRGRLLQAGGTWDGVSVAARERQLARVEVDIDGLPPSMLAMNPEKSRVQVGPDFAALAASAVAEDGTGFADYLSDAEDRFRESRKRRRARKSMIPPGKGFAPQLKRAIRDEIPMQDHQVPINMRWTRFDRAHREDFFRVDRAERVLWLNERFRPLTKSGRRGSNDAALLKSLLYLLMEQAFTGEYLGVRDRDNIELWQEILSMAAKVDMGE